jgi:hypothetical protein
MSGATPATHNNTDSQLFYSYKHPMRITWSANAGYQSFNPFEVPEPEQDRRLHHHRFDNTGANAAYSATFNINQQTANTKKMFTMFVYFRQAAESTPTPTVTPTPTATATATATQQQQQQQQRQRVLHLRLPRLQTYT